MREVNRYYATISQPIELLGAYCHTAGAVHAHGELVVQRAVDADIELTIVRVREQDHRIIAQQAQPFGTIFDFSYHGCGSCTTKAVGITISKREASYGSNGRRYQVVAGNTRT